MAERRFFLNEEDAFLFREMKEWFRANVRSHTARPYDPPGPGKAPDVLVVRVPAGGVSGLDENLTGTGTGTVLADDMADYADCEAYHLTETGGFRPLGFTVRCFNRGLTAIEGDSWAVAARQRGGAPWVIQESESDNGVLVVRVLQTISGVSENVTGTGTGTVLADDVASSALCEVYSITDSGFFTPRGFTIRVFNTQVASIRANSWAVAVLDRYNRWVFAEARYRVSGATGETITYVLDACLSGNFLKVAYQTYNLGLQRVESTWCVSNPVCRPECFEPGCDLWENRPSAICISITQQPGGSYCSGLIGVSFEAAWDVAQEGYLIDYSLGGYSISGILRCVHIDGSPNCGNMPLGFHWGFTGGVGCPDFLGVVYEPCVYANQTTISESSDPFQVVLDLYPDTIRLTCAPAPCAGTGTGPDSGTGTGTGDYVITNCCPSGVPPLLYLTLVGSGACSCLDGTYPLVWGGVEWFYQNVSLCAGDGVVMSISCNEATQQWIVQVSCYDGGDVVTWTWTVTGTCSFPISLTSDAPSGSVGANCCFDNVSGAISL